MTYVRNQYQTFINNRINQQRELDPKWNTYRKLCQRCGFTSPNFLQMVAQGKRELSPVGLRQVIEGLALTNDERATLTELYLRSIQAKVDAPLVAVAQTEDTQEVA